MPLITTLPGTVPSGEAVAATGLAERQSESARILGARLVWLYAFLWMFEGAIRFWVVPSMASVITIIRDPVVIAIYLAAMMGRRFPWNGYLVATVGLAVISFASALAAGHGRADVALYGIRCNYLHLPLIMVIPQLLNREELRRLGIVMVALLLPITLLCALQFKSPPTSIVNMGGFRTHYGTVRPAGTFSFVAGMASYAALVCAFVAYGISRKGYLPKWLLLTGIGSMLAYVVLSGSRSAVIGLAMVALALFAGTALSRKGLLRFVTWTLIATALVGTLLSLKVLKTGQQQLMQRFNDTLVGSQKENTLDRIVYGFTSPYHVMTHVPAMGYGLGSGTLAGAFMLTGTKTFLGGENEWERVIYETGGILGFAFILLRLSLAWKMLSGSVVAAWRGNTLPLLIFAAAVVPLAMGQWGVPMLQGYASLAAGLCFASIRLSQQEERHKRKDRLAARARRALPTGTPRPAPFPR